MAMKGINDVIAIAHNTRLTTPNEFRSLSFSRENIN